MRVSLLVTGGFAGRRLEADLDTDQVLASETADPGFAQACDVVVAMVGTMDAATGPTTPTTATGRIGADAVQPTYRLTIHGQDPADRRVLVLTQSQIPAALRPLITELVRRTGPAG